MLGAELATSPVLTGLLEVRPQHLRNKLGPPARLCLRLHHTLVKVPGYAVLDIKAAAPKADDAITSSLLMVDIETIGQPTSTVAGEPVQHQIHAVWQQHARRLQQQSLIQAKAAEYSSSIASPLTAAVHSS